MPVCFERLGPELYDTEMAPFSLKMRVLKAEEIKTLLYRCVT